MERGLEMIALDSASVFCSSMGHKTIVVLHFVCVFGSLMLRAGFPIYHELIGCWVELLPVLLSWQCEHSFVTVKIFPAFVFSLGINLLEVCRMWT